MRVAPTSAARARFRHLVAALWVSAVLPTAGIAQEDQGRGALLTALAMNECAVTEDETAILFGSQGFDPEAVRRELGQMVVDGTAFLERGYVLRVSAPLCPPVEPVPTPAQAFRQAIVDAGCSMDEREARALEIDVEHMRPVIVDWIETGAATLDWKTLTLRDCG